MAGNVREWTSSLYTSGLDAKALNTAAPDSDAWRTVRGGSWLFTTTLCRPGFRFWLAPVGRNDRLGFRVVCCPIQEP